jgi:hypothetical protein
MTTTRDHVADVLARYAWGLCTGDRDLLDGVFHEDAEVTFPTGYRALGRAAVLKELHGRQDRLAGTWSVVGSTLVVAESDAEVRANSFYFAITEMEQGPGLRSTGTYEDVFVTAEGVWQIRQRVVRPRVALGAADEASQSR